VHFTPLFVSYFNPGFAPFQERTWAGLLVFKEIFVQSVFAIVNCTLVGLNVFYSLVLTCSMTFLQ